MTNRPSISGKILTDLKPNKTSKASWRSARSVADACRAIDFGVILKWRDMRTLRRELKSSEQEEVLRHLARRVVERSSNRLQMEILIETLMIWLAFSAEESLLNAFLEELFAQPDMGDACWTLVETALTAEVVENSHDNDLFEMSVVLICELGLGIQAYNKQFPGDLPRASALIDHVATYLLSVSNTNSACIRLSLLHYFGISEHGTTSRAFTSRVMARFGHTVLDHLFQLLFRKKSEAVALQYLFENLPYVLGGDQYCQKIIFETFKFYLLKRPDRFSLFVVAFSEELRGTIGDPSYRDACHAMARHLSGLLKVVSDVNHHQLGKYFIKALLKFEREPYCRKLINALEVEEQLRPTFRSLLRAQRGKTEEAEDKLVADDETAIRSAKRGRRPTFSRADFGIMHQVNYLSTVDVPKAS